MRVGIGSSPTILLQDVVFRVRQSVEMTLRHSQHQREETAQLRDSSSRIRARVTVSSNVRMMVETRKTTIPVGTDSPTTLLQDVRLRVRL
jgi:hypothetical protein